jgi:hypothetical protein
MENKLGRLLTDEEVVHHKKHNEKKNNSESNLEVRRRSEHAREHGLLRGSLFVRLKCPGCLSVFEKERRNTHLVKGGTFSCCSVPCRGLFVSMLRTRDPRAAERLAGNVIESFRKRKKK